MELILCDVKKRVQRLSSNGESAEISGLWRLTQIEHNENIVPYTPQRIRDPVHNLIEFGAVQLENTMWKVIGTRPFQRLRRVKQLGFSDFVYPGATHSRFAHSIGVFHTARRLMNIIAKHLHEKRNFDETKAKVALAAALVHDLGHGPFSHAFEDVGKRFDLENMKNHEAVTAELIRNSEVTEALKELGSGFADDVANVVTRKEPNSLYDAVVSSQFDADRLDYMQRDRLMTGTRLSAIDFDWLVANLEVGEISVGVDDVSAGKIETFVLGPKAFYAAEAYVLALFQLYPTVYFHKTTRGAEKLFSELLYRFISLVRDGFLEKTGLPINHPLTKFAMDPEKREHILDLDDTIVWGALAMMSDANDAVISEFSYRLRDRRFFKCIDLRERLIRDMKIEISSNDSLLAAQEKHRKIDEACDSVRRKIEETQRAATSNPPHILIDLVFREPYKKAETTGPLNQIIIRTPDRGYVNLAEQSRVVAASMKFRADRIYVARDDEEALQFVEKIIAEEKDHGKG